MLAPLALGIVTSPGAARPIDPYSAGFVSVRPQQSTNGNTSTAQNAIQPIGHRAHSSAVAALTAAWEQAVANHVPPSGRYSTADVSTYATVNHPARPASTPANSFDWGDASIGAAAGLAISAIALGGVLIASRRREHDIPPFSS